MRESLGIDTSDYEVRLYPGCQYETAMDPSELASLIRTFVAPGDGTRSSGVHAQIVTAERLHEIALKSVADARTVVSSEGLLRRVVGNLSATTTGSRMKLAFYTLSIVSGAVISADNAVCARIAEEATLRQSLLRLTVRGPGRGDGSPTALFFSVEAMRHAAIAFLKLTVRPALVGVCALDVDALSDADLQALVDGGVSREKDTDYTASVIEILGNCCSCSAPLLHRLVGPAGLPLALSKLLASEAGFPEGTRVSAVTCIHNMIDATRTHGPPIEAWAKPIIKHLRSAFKCIAIFAPGTSPAGVCTILSALSHSPPLVRPFYPATWSRMWSVTCALIVAGGGGLVRMPLPR